MEKTYLKNKNKIKTLGDLKASDYRPIPVKDELRDNLIGHIQNGQPLLKDILGYDKTVIPDLQRALLSRHNIIFLGLRGQAKSKIARLMVDLLDEYIPVIEGADLNDDPLRPISRYARELVAAKGDQTPVTWLHRIYRYSEKLATLDVSVADLIGDVDPIKAASKKLPYSDERVLHFGLVPRSHRGFFVINELPDLQPRIQVSLFNILQEGDIQIRGFKLRLPLDIQFIFTANPEDYTNRGTIVTPLKDRIESQILTHYPKKPEISKQITQQEARTSKEQMKRVEMHSLVEDLLEQVAIEARNSEFVDEKSGVSARLTITGYENMISAVERRSLLHNEKKGYVRITDFNGVIPSITGKIELVYEGEQEGPFNVAQRLIGKAIRKLFVNYFPDPKELEKKSDYNPYQVITQWFGKGNMVDFFNDMSQKQYENALKEVRGLEKMVNKYQPELKSREKYLFMEFALHGLAEHSLLSKHNIEEGQTFKDILSGMINIKDEGEGGSSEYGSESDDDYLI